MQKTHERIVSEIARWNLDLKFEDIPASVVEKARWQAMSVFSSVYAGSSLKSSAAILRAVRKMHKGRAATILSTGEKSSLEGAILVNASMSIAHDFDDYLFMGHTGHAAVLVSLAMSEALRKNASDWMVCQVAANELAGRLGASAILGPLNGQMWSFIHLLSAACIAGRMLALTPTQMEHAIGIALSQPTYPSAAGFFGAGTKLLTASWPSVLGLQAAFFAAEGLTGPRNILDPACGFYRHFSFYPIWGAWDALGERWLTETLAIKRFPGCAYIDSGVDALSSLLERYQADKGRQLDVQEIREIEVRTTLLTCEMERLSEQCAAGIDPVRMNFSLRLSLAWLLLRGSLRARVMTEENVAREETRLRSLADKIRIVQDMSLNRRLLGSLLDKAGLGRLLAELGPRGVVSVLSKAIAHYGLLEHMSAGKGLADMIRAIRIPRGNPRRWLNRLASAYSAMSKMAGHGYSLRDIRTEEFSFPFASRVTVRLSNGETFTQDQEVPLGAPGNPNMDLKDVAREKFSGEAKTLLGVERASRALKALEALSPKQKLSTLITLLAPPPKGVR